MAGDSQAGKSTTGNKAKAGPRLSASTLLGGSVGNERNYWSGAEGSLNVGLHFLGFYMAIVLSLARLLLYTGEQCNYNEMN